MSGKVVQTIVFSLDITERKKMEEQLKQQTELLTKIFEQAPIAMALLRTDGSFSYWNSALVRLTGYFRSDFRQLKFEDIVFCKELTDFRKKFLKIVEKS